MFTQKVNVYVSKRIYYTMDILTLYCTQEQIGSYVLEQNLQTRINRLREFREFNMWNRVQFNKSKLVGTKRYVMVSLVKIYFAWA